MASDDMRSYLMSTAANLGIHPSDLATAISYETMGRFDPNLWGGAGGKHLGLIQFGPEEQAKYGVKPDMPLSDHFGAVENFLRDRGVKPGMGMLDIYSTINAGRPGLYNASDANNGGAPGTVADKVATQMVGHRARADAMLGSYDAPPAQPVAQNSPTYGETQPQNMPMSLAPPTPQQPAQQAANPNFNAGALGKMAMSLVNGDQSDLVPMQFQTPPGIAAIRARLAQGG